MKPPAFFDPNSPLAAVLVCSLAILLLSAMDVVMKGLVLAVGVYSAVLWRCALASLVVGAVWATGPRIWPNRRAMRLHTLRAVMIGGVLIFFFWGLARLPLAEAVALSFIAPLIALVLAALVLGEQIRKEAIWGSIAGLAGVAIVIVGQFGKSDYGEDALLGTVAVLLSTVFYAFNIVLARKQALAARPLEIALFQNLVLAVLLALASPWLARSVPAEAWPYLAGATALSLSGQLLMSWAYARAEAQYLIPTEYSAFIWAAGFGWFFFNEPLAWTTVAGASLIIAGCLVAARAKPRLSQPIEAPT